jgi:hypothetical protein
MVNTPYSIFYNWYYTWKFNPFQKHNFKFLTTSYQIFMEVCLGLSHLIVIGALSTKFTKSNTCTTMANKTTSALAFHTASRVVCGASRPPGPLDRPSHPPDKGQTSVGWPPMVNLKGQTSASALPWTATSNCQPPRDHVSGQQ